jgi:hypothetical protein
MLPRAAPRPRAGACTLESSLRCLRTSDHRVLRGVLEIREKSTCPRRCWTGASRAGICLPRDAHAAPGCPEAPSRRLHPGVLPPLPAHLGSSSSSGGCWKFEKIDLPPTMLDRRFKSRHLLTQRRACCPGLPRGPEQAPAPWSPPSAACAPRIIELFRGVLEIRENRPSPDDAGPALQEPASAYPETRMLPRAAPRPRAGALHPGVLPPLPAHLGSSSSSGGVGNSRKSTFPRRCWTGASRAGICLPRGAHAAPGCPEAPSRRLHPGVLPPLPAHLGSSSSSGGCWKFEKIDLPPTMLDRRFKSRHLLTQRRACCPGLPRGPEQAPAPWSPPSAACAPRIIELFRGVLEIRENRPSPDDAGPALQEPASAYPEARMLPRAAPRPRAGACTLESSLRCLRTSDHRALPGGVGNSRKSTFPRRCWTGASRAGICLPRGAHAAPGCPEAPSRRLHPGVLPPLPAHLGSSSSSGGCWKFEKIDLPPTMLDRRFKSRHLLTQRRACCPGLPRGPEQAPAPWSPPSAACAPRIIELSWGVGNSRKSTCPDDAGPALQEPASAYPEARMLPRAAPRPRAGACTLESSLRCLRTSDHRVLRGVLEIRENRPAPDDAGPALQEPASAYPEARMLPRAAPRPRAGACTLEFSLRCLRTSDHRALLGCWKFEKIDLPPTMLDRRFKSRHLLTQRRACCPGLPRGPEQAPAPWSPPSAACAPRIIELFRGVLENRENRPSPDDAGPALQEPASAYPETRMLPRAAPRPRAGACTLESSLRCLRISDHRALLGCWKFEKIDLPRRCWTGASRAGICLPRGAHAAPGCPEAPSRRLHPGVLPPLPAHLG